ncbi:MAG: hypothetical protein CSA68_09060 [Rhodobacterales bacterium]|nr:MAG: hypothetical protein CSA68_09060 [Rhodobacterales bacterium]
MGPTLQQPLPRSRSFQTVIRSNCAGEQDICGPGCKLIESLCAAIATASDMLADDFSISGTACITACQSPCMVGYHADKKTAYLFADIDPDQDIDALLRFARRYRSFHEGRFPGQADPAGLSHPGLARMPSVIIAQDIEVLQ